MGKNVLLATLLLISVYFGFMSNSKSKEVQKQKAIAEANLELAQKSEEKAIEQEKLALEYAQKVIEAQRMAEEAIANCK